MPPDTTAAASARPQGDPSESGFERLATKWMDRLNALVIRETRQALKGKQFQWSFIISLLVATLVALIGSSVDDADVTDIAVWYFGILSFVLWFVVPASAFQSIVQELDEGTWEMMAITTLSPGQIVRGKFSSSIVQGVLYASGIVPFLAFAYFLRGIDIGTIVLYLMIAFLGSGFLVSFAIFWATLSTMKINRRFLGLLLFAGLGFSVIGGCALGYELCETGMAQDYFTNFWTKDVIFPNLVALFFGGSYLFLFLALAVSRLSFEASNKSTLPRLVLFLQWVFWTAAMGYGFFYISTSRDPEFAFLYAVPAFVQIYLIGIFACTESNQLSRRIVRSYPTSMPGRLMALFFWPGGARGYLYFLCLAGATCAAALYGVSKTTSIGFFVKVPEARNSILAVFAYVVIYVTIPVLLIRLLIPRLKVHLQRWLIVLFLILLSTAPLVTLMFREDRFAPPDVRYFVTNPVVTIVSILGEGWGGPSPVRYGIPETLAVIAGCVAVGRLAQMFLRRELNSRSVT